jgi:aspartate aminotransferase
MKLSKRIKEAQYSPIRKFYKYANEAKKRGIHVYHLNIGQPDIPAPPTFFKALKEFKEKVISYAPSEGTPLLRKAWFNYYKRRGYNIDEEDILVTTAGSEALIFSFFSVCDEGDEIIVFEPFYTNYITFSKLAGVKLVPIPTSIEDNFKLPDKKIIEKYITSRTRAILYASPNNPTGKVYTKEEIEILISLAKKYELFIIADEVYREFVYDNLKHVSILEFDSASDFSIVTDSVSKRYSLCGARIGCVVTRNKELKENLVKLCQARLSSPIIEQYACARVIEEEDKFIEESKKEYENRRKCAMEILLNQENIRAFKPNGAFYTMVEFKGIDAEDYTRFLLESFNIDNKTTMVAPGSGFYVTSGKGLSEVRLAFVLNSKDLEEAIHILIKGLEKYRV